MELLDQAIPIPVQNSICRLSLLPQSSDLPGHIRPNFAEPWEYLHAIQLAAIPPASVGNHNIGAHAQVDPEAAKVVFESQLPVVMVPLEVTHTALATQPVLKAIMGPDPKSPFLLLVKEIILYFADTYASVFAFKEPPLHDPCAVFYIIQPQAFTVCPYWVNKRLCSAP